MSTLPRILRYFPERRTHINTLEKEEEKGAGEGRGVLDVCTLIHLRAAACQDVQGEEQAARARTDAPRLEIRPTASGQCNQGRY